MKKLVAFIMVLLLACPCALADENIEAEKQSIYLGNYEYSVPASWLIKKSAEGYNYHYETGNVLTGAYVLTSAVDVGFSGQDYNTIKKASEELFESAFNGYADSLGIHDYEIIDIEIESAFDQFPYKLSRGNAIISDIEFTIYLFAWVDFNYLYQLVYINPVVQEDEAIENIRHMLSQVTYAGPTANSRMEPGRVGEKERITLNDNGMEYTMQVVVDEFYRGEEYIALVGNNAKVAAEGYEYVAVKVTVEFLRIDKRSGDIDPEIAVDEVFDFKSYHSSGAKYDNIHYTIRGMKTLTSIFEGASTTGYFQFEIEKDDPAPLLVYEPEYDERIWISLSE